jgi:tetratricopeptide repeat protein
MSATSARGRETGAEAAPFMAEDFTPLSSSAEWRIGASYWSDRGYRAFLRDSVPHLITNDGMLAARWADVLFAGCRAADAAGKLEDEIEVLELGTGLGTNALLLLDRFVSLCRDAAVDYHDRLTYLVSDVSPQMLHDIAGADTFARHRGRVRLCQVDARSPATAVDFQTGVERRLGPLRAVLHSYVLDTLPVEVVTPFDGRWLRLHLRTWLRNGRRSLASLERTGGLDPEAGQALVELSESMYVESAYLPMDLWEVPYAEFLPAYVEQAAGGRPLSSIAVPFGAVDSLVRSLELLRDDGFLLLSDFGSDDPDAGGVHAHVRYAGSRSVPLSFPLVFHILEQVSPWELRVMAPPGDDRAPLRTRLVARAVPEAVAGAFAAGFDQRVFELLADHLERAQRARDRGHLDLACAILAEASGAFPENWYLLIEQAETALRAQREPSEAIALATRALEANPTGSVAIREVLGDALAADGRPAEAERQYRLVLKAVPGSVRATAGLAGSVADQGRHEEAIELLGQAMSADATGRRRAPLETMLRHVLDRRYEGAGEDA